MLALFTSSRVKNSQRKLIKASTVCFQVFSYYFNEAEFSHPQGGCEFRFSHASFCFHPLVDSLMCGNDNIWSNSNETMRCGFARLQKPYSQLTYCSVELEWTVKFQLKLITRWRFWVCVRVRHMGWYQKSCWWKCIERGKLDTKWASDAKEWRNCFNRMLCGLMMVRCFGIVVVDSNFGSFDLICCVRLGFVLPRKYIRTRSVNIFISAWV